MIQPWGLIIGTDVGLAARVELVLREADIELRIASGPEQAHKICREHGPSLLMLDFDRKARETVRLLGELREQGVFAPVLWLCAVPTREIMERIRRSGAQGVLSKAAAPNTVIDAVHTLLRGEDFFPLHTNPATPGAKALAESERLLKVLKPKESAS